MPRNKSIYFSQGSYLYSHDNLSGNYYKSIVLCAFRSRVQNWEFRYLAEGWILFFLGLCFLQNNQEQFKAVASLVAVVGHAAENTDSEL
jgi:hypothetical protein